jgi:hypothetical protein
LKEIMEEIMLVPEPDGIYAEIKSQSGQILAAAVGASVGRVAGAGFEPTTFGL